MKFLVRIIHKQATVIIEDQKFSYNVNPIALDYIGSRYHNDLFRNLMISCLSKPQMGSVFKFM